MICGVDNLDIRGFSIIQEIYIYIGIWHVWEVLAHARPFPYK